MPSRTRRSPEADAASREPAPYQTPLHPHLLSLEPYPPGKPIEEVQREYGLEEVIKLASNENPLGPSPKAQKAMAHAAAEMNLYPDGAGFYLKRALARKLGVTPREIVLGNGSDEITLFLALAYLGPRFSAVTSDLAFVRYRMAAQLVGAEATIVPMKRFRHDPAALAAAVQPSTRLIFIDNPCNPTGTIVNKSELARLLREIPERVLVVLDEAYHEYARHDPQYPDTLALRKKHPNLIVKRTFSKAYGLAGLRIGYGIAHPAVIEDLERVRPPFNANRMAQAAALAALEDTAWLGRVVRTNDEGKEQLAKLFKDVGLKAVPTWANFFLVDLSKTEFAGMELYQALLEEGIIVRPMGGYGLERFVRISIGTRAENNKLAQVLTDLLSR